VREVSALRSQLDEIGGWLAEGEVAVAKRAPAVSGWSVA
jgi:hypothetical protein